MASLSPTTFGDLLKQLRKRAGLTQRELAAAVGYSLPFISNLELNQRLPDVQAVVQTFVPALRLQDDPTRAAHLIEQAVVARGERPPAAVTLRRTVQVTLQEESAAHAVPLPPVPLPLIGRSAAIEQISNRLLGRQGRLLTLLGVPGVGKSTLALAVAHHLQLHYADGVVFVPLAAVSDATLMAATIAAAIGTQEGGAKSPQSRLIESLRRKTMLLVLDNLEQIHEAPALVAALIAECPHLCILTTSRERLHLRVEQRYKVPPLDLAATVTLFTQRAQAVEVDFAVTADNQPMIAAICDRLDCLPLAIELCAAQIDLLAPAQLLGRLQGRLLEVLVDGPLDLPPQHRTLRAAIGRSYALLTTDEQALLRSLSVFAGGFDLAAVEQMNDWENDQRQASLLATLHALVGKSLVRSETLAGDGQRFSLLATIREFAWEQLTASGEAALYQQRHFVNYLHFARTVDQKVRGPAAVTWFAHLDREHDNLRAAWQWALATHHFVEAAWLGVALCHSWHVRAHWYEGAQWLEQLLPQRHQLPPDLRLTLLLTLYRFWRARHNFAAIEQVGAELTLLCDTCTSPLLRAAAWFYLSVTAAAPAQSLTAFEQCLTLLHEATVAPPPGAEFCYFTDGVNLQAMALVRYAIRLTDEIGDYGRAEQLTHASLRLFQQQGNRDFVAYAIGNLGRLALVRGDITQAHQHLQEAVALATAVGNSMSLADWQPRLGIVTLYCGNASEARRLLDDCLARCLPLGNDEYLARIYGYLAEVALWEEQLDEAEAWMAQSAAYQPKLRWLMIEMVDFLFVCARLATAQQQYGEAARRFGLAEGVAQRIGYRGFGPMRPQIEAARSTVCAALSAALFAASFAVGQQMALAEAFAALRSPPPMTSDWGTAATK